MPGILTLLEKETDSSDMKVLRCGNITVDPENYSYYLESQEHPAQAFFEYPKPSWMTRRVQETPDDVPSILRYFLDGSRKTYRVADICLDGRYYPLIAGQVGVCVLERESTRLKPLREFSKTENLLAFPDRFPESDLNILQDRIARRGQVPFRFVNYTHHKDKDPIDSGIAKINVEMQTQEIQMVYSMAQNHLLANDRLLVIDGPLQFRRKVDLFQFRNVIGLSKSFRPTFSLGKGRSKRDVGTLTSGLRFRHRTPAYKAEFGEKTICMWYLRLRPLTYASNPLQGVVKIEKYAIQPEDKERGISTNTVDTISRHLLSERNVSPYGRDPRWASHIYPIYQSETYLKSSFMSDTVFKGLF